MQAVTVLISRQVKPEYEVEFERVMDQIIATAATFKGYLGAHLVRPGDEQGVNDSLHHVVMAFDSEANLDLWQNSPARSLGLAAAAPFIEGQALIRHVSGLAHWFLPRGESKQVPRRDGRWPLSPGWASFLRFTCCSWHWAICWRLGRYGLAFC